MTDARISEGTPMPRQAIRVEEQKNPKANGMREIVFLVTAEQPGRIEATAPDRGLVVEAPTLEELHHEARDALIRQVGPSHATYRIRIRRAGQNLVSARGAQLAHCHLFPSARSLPKSLQKNRAVRQLAPATVTRVMAET